ncbi:DUF975 family protein [bacterium SCSIO 12643]|nr:DUF975 family protein [bacterium SCSIO 12643]
MTQNAELMRIARRSLDGKWVLAVGTHLIFIIISAALQGLTSYFEAAGLLYLITSGPLALGLSIFALNIYKDEDAGVENLFEGFQNFVNSAAAYLLMTLFIILWSLLLIIPGIIASISYSQTMFIMADDPNIGPMDAIDKSKEMMYGYKMKYFRMMLRLLGLGLLCILTLGIGFFFLIPYAQVLMAAFYQDLKGETQEEEATLYE